MFVKTRARKHISPTYAVRVTKWRYERFCWNGAVSKLHAVTVVGEKLTRVRGGGERDQYCSEAPRRRVLNRSA